MAPATVGAVALVGVEGHLVDVEADLAQGLPAFALVGLPDTSLSEARDRVRAAIVNSGQGWPARRITVNLSPASLPKRGSSFDLAIAAAVLVRAEVAPARWFRHTVLLGELGLDGRLRPVRGILPAVAAAAAAGVTRVVVPEPNVAEARLVPDVDVFGLRSLRQLVALTRGEPVPDEAPLAAPAEVAPGVGPGGAPRSSGSSGSSGSSSSGEPAADLADVVGQPIARWGLEVAAAGGHHLLMLGPPGAGKTMLAERLPGLLPDLDRATALEVTAVHSVAGTLPLGVPLLTRPPFQAPHHTATVASIVGGGSGLPRPGAAALAHRGVLFLDEAPEFASGVLDALRQPLESGEIVLARAKGTARYPARFRLVLAANPCPCGKAVDRGLGCHCPPTLKRRYLSRLSGPLLDRVDIQLLVRRPSAGELASDQAREDTTTVAARVLAARERAQHRFTGTTWRCNADVPGRELQRRWPLQAGPLGLVDAALGSGRVSMRGADRVLRVAWTLADLDAAARPSIHHVRAALGFRSSDPEAA